jgi:hypothetical protein
MAAGARVVVSDVCGAMSEIKAGAGTVVPLHASIEQWVQAVRAQMQQNIAPPLYAHSWADVAHEYEALYRTIVSE